VLHVKMAGDFFCNLHRGPFISWNFDEIADVSHTFLKAAQFFLFKIGDQNRGSSSIGRRKEPKPAT
jgi:hypothetical protein